MTEPILTQHHPCGCVRAIPTPNILCPTARFLRDQIIIAQDNHTSTADALAAYEAHYPRGFTPDITHLVCPDCNQSFLKAERRNTIRYNPITQRDHLYFLCPPCRNNHEVQSRPTINPASKDPDSTQQ